METEMTFAQLVSRAPSAWVFPGLMDIPSKDQKCLATPDEIITAVCETFKIPKEQITRRSRRRCIVVPRQLSVFLMRKCTDLSLKRIGEIYQQDHTTIIHTLNVIKNDLANDEVLNRNYKHILFKLKLKSE